MTVISEQKSKVRSHSRTQTNRWNKYNKNKTGGVNVKSDSDDEDDHYSFGPMPICLIRAMFPRNLNPRIESIIYWRNVRKSLMFFLTGIILFAAISHYSLVSVVSYLSLAFLTSTFILRLCEMVLRKNFLNSKWSNKEDFDEFVLRICIFLFYIAGEIRDIVFVKSLIRTIKIFIILLFWTYIGELMNGFTLLVSLYVSIFIVPKLCEVLIAKLWQKSSRKARRDSNVEMQLREHLKAVQLENSNTK